MSSSEVAAWVISLLAGLTALVSAITAMIQVSKVKQAVGRVDRAINGRLDELLAEREARVRAESLLHAARVQEQPLPPPPATGRREPIIRPMRPDQTKMEDES